MYAHFCRARDDRTLDPLRLIEGLSTHLARRLPAYAQAVASDSSPEIRIEGKATAEHAEAGAAVSGVVVESLHIGNLSTRLAFDRVIRRPLEVALADDPTDQPLVLLIDGLDEALTYGDDNIVDLIAAACDTSAELPPTVRLLLTSRPDERVLRPLGLVPLDLLADAPGDTDDVRTYIRQRLGDIDPDTREVVSAKVAASADGSFLYARYVVDDLLADPGRMEHPSELSLPTGLAGHYHEYLTRELVRRSERWEDRYRPLLGLLAVARGAGIPRSLLVAATDLEEDRVDDALRVIGQYLSGPPPEGPFRLYHQSFRDFLLTDSDHAIYPELASRRLAEALLDGHPGRWSAATDSGADPADAYAIDNVVAHLTDALASTKNRAKGDDLRACLTDVLTTFAFLEARTHRSVYALLSDFGSALGLMPAEGEERRQLAPIEELLRYDSHFLSRHPAALLDRCWFRGWWFDAPATTSFFTNDESTPAGAAGTRLSELVERWRAEKEARSPGFRWLRALRPPSDRLGGPQLAVLSGHDDELSTVDVSPDGFRLVSSGEDGIRLWDVADGQQVAVLEAPEDAYPAAACFSPRGDAVAAGFSDGTISILRSSDLRELRHVAPSPDVVVEAMAYTPDGSALVTADWDGTIRLLETGTLEEHDSQPTDHRVEHLLFSPDGGLLAVGAEPRGGHGIVQVWRLPDNRLELHVEFSSEASVEDVAWTPDGQWLAWAAYDGTIELRNIQTGAADKFTAVDGDAAGCLAFLPDGDRLICGKGGAWGAAPITIWDLKTKSPVRTLHGHTDSVAALRVFAEGHRLVSAGDATLRIWSLDDDRRNDVVSHEPTVDSMQFSPDGILVLTASETSETAWVRRVDTGEVVATLTGHTGGVHELAARAGRWGCGSGDGLVRVWDTNSDQPPLDLTGHTDTVSDLVFSSDGQLLATAAYDGTERVYNLDDGRQLASFSDHPGAASSVALSPDGRRAASAGYYPPFIRVWGARDGTLHSAVDLRGGGPFGALAFTNDGRHIVADHGGTTRAWDADTGTKVPVDHTHRDALAATESQYQARFHWRVEHPELVLYCATTNEPVAWLPIPSGAIHDHPSGRIWAIHRGTWLFMVELESAAP